MPFGDSPVGTLLASRTQRILLFVGAMLFVVIGVVMVASGSVLAAVWGVFTVVFFRLAGGYLLVELVHRRPVVVLDNEGITVRAHLAAAGRISWPEIEDVVVYRVNRQRMAGILLRDPQRFIARASPLRRFFMRVNARLGYPVVNIPANALSIDLEELIFQMRTFKPDIGNL